VQLLRSHLRASDRSDLVSELGPGAAEIAPILPELHELIPGLSEPTAPEPEGARFRLFHATAELLRRASEKRSLVLILDDLHAADTPSLLMLQFLARGLGSMHVLVLAAMRDVDPVPGEPLTAMLAEVARESVTRRIALSGLSERDVAEYLQRTATAIASAELAAELHAETEGNPLFVTETVRLLLLEGLRPGPGGAVRLEIPQSVRDVISRRLAHLSAARNQVLAFASVLGREFVLELLARVGEVSIDDLLETLDEALSARVIGEVPGVADRLRFTHVVSATRSMSGFRPPGGCSSMGAPLRHSKVCTVSIPGRTSPSLHTTRWPDASSTKRCATPGGRRNGHSRCSPTRRPHGYTTMRSRRSS
jgi:predicted ATPase